MEDAMKKILLLVLIVLSILAVVPAIEVQSSPAPVVRVGFGEGGM